MDTYFRNSVNRLILEEIGYDREEMKLQHEKNHRLLNTEQKNVYDSLIQNINEDKELNKKMRIKTECILYMKVEVVARLFVADFILDGPPMQHRHAFECVDQSLRDIMSVVDKRRSKKSFGGITIVFGRDF